MNNRLVNPYKFDELPPTLVHLQADVSQADWDKIYLAYPYKGVQDKIISMLFKKFVEAVEKEQIKPTPNKDNEQRLANLIQGCSFAPTGGEEH